jgi:hypothetical protein
MGGWGSGVVMFHVWRYIPAICLSWIIPSSWREQTDRIIMMRTLFWLSHGPRSKRRYPAPYTTRLLALAKVVVLKRSRPYEAEEILFWWIEEYTDSCYTSLNPRNGGSVRAEPLCPAWNLAVSGSDGNRPSAKLADVEGADA